MGKVLAHLSSRDYFGEMALLASPAFGEKRFAQGATRMCTALAVTLVDVLALAEKSLLSVSREYPQVRSPHGALPAGLSRCVVALPPPLPSTPP